MCLTIFFRKKKTFRDNKNINFGKMKNCIFPNELGHGFGQKFKNYLSFFFRENREGKSVWQYSLQRKKSRKLAL